MFTNQLSIFGPKDGFLIEFFKQKDEKDGVYNTKGREIYLRSKIVKCS
jgi:hypothetical protein